MKALATRTADRILGNTVVLGPVSILDPDCYRFISLCVCLPYHPFSVQDLFRDDACFSLFTSQVWSWHFHF